MSVFVGTGRNPDGPDLPIGFGMHLAQNPRAMEAYGRLSKQRQRELIGYIQGGGTGEDALNRIMSTIAMLNNGQ